MVFGYASYVLSCGLVCYSSSSTQHAPPAPHRRATSSSLCLQRRCHNDPPPLRPPPSSAPLRPNYSHHPAHQPSQPHRPTPLPQDMDAGPITSISFSPLAPRVNPINPLEAPALERFIAPDFMVGTSAGVVVAMTSSVFDEWDPAKRTGRRLLPGTLTCVAALATHPTRGAVAVGGGSVGEVHVWDFEGYRLEASAKVRVVRGGRGIGGWADFCLVASWLVCRNLVGARSDWFGLNTHTLGSCRLKAKQVPSTTKGTYYSFSDSRLKTQVVSCAVKQTPVSRPPCIPEPKEPGTIWLEGDAQVVEARDCGCVIDHM